jgi:transcriptional regulator with XRE-family HTH domain
LTNVSVSATIIRTMGIRLREWRARRGLSLRELGQRAAVSYVTVARIEAGRMSPTVALLEKLAEALGIAVRDFFPANTRPTPRSRRRRR